MESKMEKDWRDGLVEELAKDLWAGFCHWDLETHNLGWPTWDELDDERKGRFVALAEQVVADRKSDGHELKQL